MILLTLECYLKGYSMKKKTRRKKQEEFNKRYDAIKSLMSTFTMGTVAVVAAVTLIPASPKAEIIKTTPLSEEITYQVTVTDEEQALDLETLYVVLENQLEYYEKQISLGENSGYFDNLNTNTEYRLSVYGNKGFGQERLDTIIVTTRAKVGGTILEIIPEETSGNYSVSLSVYDPDNKYNEITLYYGYAFHPGEEIMYSSINLTPITQTIVLTNIFSENPFHVYLEGTTINGTELLDEMWVTPPFELYASLYPSFYTQDTIGFHLYHNVEDITYHIEVFDGGNLVKKDTVSPSQEEHEGYKYVLEGLSPNTTYIIKAKVTYINPQTLREEEYQLPEEEFTTLQTYSYTYTINEIDDQYEITVTLFDPYDQFQYVYTEIYDSIENMYIDGNIYNFTGSLEDKTVTFTLNKPMIDSFEIFIGMRNSTSYMMNQELDYIRKD